MDILFLLTPGFTDTRVIVEYLATRYGVLISHY